MDLTGKKVLLIVPAFYGYERLLREALENLGAKVTYRENKAFRNDPVTKDTKWYLTLLCKKNSYIKKELIPLSQQRFDVCIFINLFSFHPGLIENLKKENPDIFTILYLWDNVRDYRWQPFFKYFNNVYSFDPVESRELGLKYLPNFYPSGLAANPGEKDKFDVSFVGSLQVHRFRLLNTLTAKLKAQKRTFYFHLYLHPNYNRLKYNKYVHAMLSLFPGQFKGYKSLYKLISRKVVHELVFHHPLTIPEAIQSLASSACVLDLPFPSQTGSTQRMIQALALQKKVITTNSSVTQESFYNSEYIKIMTGKDIGIDWDWVSRRNVTPLNIDHLRLDNWLIQLLKD